MTSKTILKKNLNMSLYVLSLSVELGGKFGHYFEHCFVFVFSTGGSVFDKGTLVRLKLFVVLPRKGKMI